MLKIASPRDKVVQRILTDILGAIYEPSFYEHSYGFRAGRSPHDALHFIRHHFQGVRWVIEGDIAKCFDEIDHHLLISILRKRIKDERFIRLIWKALRAGFLSDWGTPQDCLIGTPQGSIVSPILCNIFLNEFDLQVSHRLLPHFNYGKRRAQPPEYKRLAATVRWFSHKYRRTGNPSDKAEAIFRRKRFQSMPSVDPRDPNFRRLLYVRFADDWIIGFAGPWSEAIKIRDQCATFLSNIKLRLSPEKTAITRASEGWQFLGTRIRVPIGEDRLRRGSRGRASLGVRLNCPIPHVIKKLSSAGYCTGNGFPTPRFALFAADKDEIVITYSSVMRGILNHYSFADNYPRLAHSLFYILRGSACKLLAAKFRLRTSRQVLKRFGPFLKGSDRNALPDPKSPTVRGGEFKFGREGVSRTRIFRRASLALRTDNLECAVCGSTFRVEMHHVRALKQLNEKLDPIS
ncbi:MAG: reverse transcriptase domain-containing protein, partial [Candidatus Aenigmatarchaeota archaeon]